MNKFEIKQIMLSDPTATIGRDLISNRFVLIYKDDKGNESTETVEEFEPKDYKKREKYWNDFMKKCGLTPPPLKPDTYEEQKAFMEAILSYYEEEIKKR